jgi:hypothetical protein
VEREGPEGRVRLRKREWLDPGHGDRQSRRVTESSQTLTDSWKVPKLKSWTLKSLIRSNVIIRKAQKAYMEMNAETETHKIWHKP